MNYRIRGFLLLFLCGVLTSCMTPMVQQTENICQIFKQYPRWQPAAKQAELHWRVPVPLLMAIIYQESRFQGRAKPKRHWLLGSRVSNSYGYAQAQRESWREYQRDTNRYYAVRDNFVYAIDFVGWYLHRSSQVLKISPTDSYRQYLAYHEGMGGYKRATFKQKAWLLKVAAKVKFRAKLYGEQLKQCIP